MDHSGTVDYYAHEQRLLKHLKSIGFQPDVIYDIGSSHAGWSKHIGRIFPDATFHLFEPLVDHKAFYRERCEEILSEHSKFHLHKIGLGDVNRTCTIVSDKAGYGASILLSAVTGDCDEFIPIKVWRLDDFVQLNNLPRPDLMKLDVQGAEILVLSGACSTLKSAKILQVEVWFFRRYASRTPLFHEVIDFLDTLSFRLFDLGEMWYQGNRQLIACDAFFVHQDLLANWQGKIPRRPLTLEC
jgi:FkbM family methyltransferase